MIQKAPGIEDIFPDRMDTWNFITSTARDVFRLFNYRELIVPVLEFTELFTRGIGSETDIVSKEMFTFEDRGGRNLTLRPEGTASVVRAYIENGEYNRLSLCKFFYSGPMFRAEKPQKGRLRQFNQIGCELFGSADPFFDCETISLMDTLVRKLGITDYTVLVNSIGCPECREKFILELRDFYAGKLESLCDDCKRRLEKNTLRLLDCKNERCVGLRKSAPIITHHLCGPCRDHYGQVKEYLDKASIVYREDPFLVRGLDYYTRTTFEFVTTKLGGQNAFAAGGRYDNLVELMGGKPTPAIGFAAGIERMALLLEGKDIPSSTVDAYIVFSGDAARDAAVDLLNRVRKAGFSADMEPEAKGFKAQLKRADRERARYALIIGEDEVKNGTVTVKNLSTGNQQVAAIGSTVESFNTV